MTEVAGVVSTKIKPMQAGTEGPKMEDHPKVKELIDLITQGTQGDRKAREKIFYKIFEALIGKEPEAQENYLKDKEGKGESARENDITNIINRLTLKDNSPKEKISALRDLLKFIPDTHDRATYAIIDSALYEKDNAVCDEAQRILKNIILDKAWKDSDKKAKGESSASVIDAGPKYGTIA